MSEFSVQSYIDPRMVMAATALSHEEVTKVMAETAKKLIQREKLFKRHFEIGQSVWPKNSPKYARWKQKKYGTSKIFERTGDARKSLTSINKKLKVHTPRRGKSLRITLRGAGYQAVQKGRFGGVDMMSRGFFGTKWKSLSAQETLERNTMLRYKKSGGKLSRKDRKRLWLDRAVTTSRRSLAPRPLVAPMPGDEKIVNSVLMEELNITMKYRGY